jgi:hypothetical protein
MPISLRRKSRLFARTFHYAIVSVTLTAFALAEHTGAKPKPHGFAPVPAPSSLLLVVAGMIGLLGWNWWRNRALQNRATKDAGVRD